MGLRINTNTSAVTALRNLSLNDKHLASSLERLSTGLRINRAADDPSGLGIGQRPVLHPGAPAVKARNVGGQG